MKKYFLIILGLFFFFMNAQKQNSIEILEKNPAYGCGDFRVLRKVKFENKENTFVILDFDVNKFKLSNKFQKFDLKNSKAVKGIVEILNTETEDNYCTDAISIHVETMHSLKIEKGTVWVRKVKDEKSLQHFDHTPYRVDVILENATFVKAGKKYFIKKIKFTNVLVSYMMG